jgi:hypothetical protein
VMHISRKCFLQKTTLFQHLTCLLHDRMPTYPRSISSNLRWHKSYVLSGVLTC